MAYRKKPSVVMLSGTQVLGPGQPSDELTWIMNQHGKVLRADPQSFATVLESDQRSHVRTTLTGQTPIRLLVAHFVSKFSNHLNTKTHLPAILP